MRQQALHWLLLLISISFSFAGCEPAGRYPARAPVKAHTEPEKTAPPADRAWIEPTPVHDVPIVFVASTSKEWASLPRFWNHYPSAKSALPLHLGLSPLGTAASLVLARQVEKIIIKVPRGLPDPTFSIPKSNPPMLAKWKLGKSLFFDKILTISKYESTACADCHKPEMGFTEDWAVNRLGKKNTPSLINCVYNTSQFWDGRVRFLEQVVVNDPASANLPPEEQASRHAWGGLVKTLADSPSYKERFRAVFGVRQPTEDTIAKALATYLRTILSGDSVYDRAEAQRQSQGASELSAPKVEAILDETGLKGLGESKKEVAAAGMVQGRQLFNGKARCAACHPPPLFTDHDFHNIGLDENDIAQILGQNRGRFDTAAVGLKETRLMGAYKTPTLRALPRTAPYMHDGKFKSLAEVVDFFDHGIDAARHRYLAAELHGASESPQRLQLSADEARALILFLRSLDGGPVDPIISQK